jgi:hypothetical protein
MLPKGYKVIIDWFHEVADDPYYENPDMRNETRNMLGELVDSDDEEEGPQKYWSPDVYEPWIPLDEKKSGVKLEEIKDEPDAKEGLSAEEARDTLKGESKIVAKENELVTQAAHEESFTALGKASNFAAEFKDILEKVSTDSADAVTAIPIRVSGLGVKDEPIADEKVVNTDVKELTENADNAGAETVL